MAGQERTPGRPGTVVARMGPVTGWCDPTGTSGCRGASRGEEHGGTAGSAGPEGYFHCVETAKPPPMSPKPTTMFQLWSASMGSEPSVT